MKNKLKKVLSLFLALVMCLSMGATVFASNGTQVPSATDARTTFVYGVEKGVTVKAYQILDATYDENGNGLTGYETAFYTDGSPIKIEDLIDITADEVNAIATAIFDGDIEPITSKTLTYAAKGTVISLYEIADEELADVTLTEEAYYGDLEAGTWLILVEDSNATIYNPMIVSHWYSDANDATSLTTGSVDADGYFYEDIYDYTTDDYGTVSWTSGSYTAVYAKSDTVSLDKDIVNYAGASYNVTYEEGTTPKYNSNLMTYGLLAEEESVDDEDSLYDFQETMYEGSESDHPNATTANTDDNADNTEGADYDIGDTVQFEIKTNIPDYADTYFDTKTHETTFMIYDDLSKGLDAIDADDLYVSVGGDLATLDTDYYVTLFDTYLYEGTYYYICTYTGTSSWYTTGDVTIKVGTVYTMSDDGTLTVAEVSSDTLTATVEDDDLPVTYTYKTGQRIVISFVEDFIAAHGGQGVIVYYATQLNSDAEIVGDENADSNPNEANLIYSNNPTTVLSTATIGKGDQVYVYTFSITDELVKVFNDNDDAADDTDDDVYDDGENESIQSDSDAGNGDPDDSDTATLAGSASASDNTVSVTNALAGAEFTIYADEDCTIPYVNQYAIDNGLVKSIEDEDNATDIDTSKYTYVYTTTSDENGYISFYGLSEGTYYIKETEAPDGYTLNSQVYKVVIEASYNTDAYTGEDDPRDDEVGLLEGYTITVTNLTTGSSYTSTYTITNTITASEFSLSGYDAERMTLSDLDADYTGSYFKSLDKTEVVYYSLTEKGLHQTYNGEAVYYVEESGITTVEALSEATNGFSYSTYLSGSETIYYCLDADGNRLTYNYNYIYWARSNKDGCIYYIYNSGSTANNYAVTDYDGYTYAVPKGDAVYTTISTTGDLGCTLPSGFDGSEQLYYSTQSSSHVVYNSHDVYYARSSSGVIYYFYYTGTAWAYLNEADAYALKITTDATGTASTTYTASLASDYNDYSLSSTTKIYYSTDNKGEYIKYADNYVYWTINSSGVTIYLVYNEKTSTYTCMTDADAYELGISTTIAGDDVAITISTVSNICTTSYLSGSEQLYYLTDSSGNIITYNNNPVYWAVSEETNYSGSVYYFIVSDSSSSSYKCVTTSTLWSNISSASSSKIAMQGEAVSVLRYYIYTNDEDGHSLCTEGYARDALNVMTASTGDPAYVTSDSSGSSITCYWDDFVAVDADSIKSNKFTYTLDYDTTQKTVDEIVTESIYWQYGFDGSEGLYYSTNSSNLYYTYNGQYVYYATTESEDMYYFYYDSDIEGYVITANSYVKVTDSDGTTTTTTFANQVSGNVVVDDQNNYIGSVVKYTITASTISISATENPVVIVNTTLIKLPSTGGMGVYLLILISVILLGAAAIIVTRKKKPEEESA